VYEDFGARWPVASYTPRKPDQGKVRQIGVWSC